MIPGVTVGEGDLLLLQMSYGHWCHFLITVGNHGHKTRRTENCPSLVNIMEAFDRIYRQRHTYWFRTHSGAERSPPTGPSVRSSCRGPRSEGGSAFSSLGLLDTPAIARRAHPSSCSDKMRYIAWNACAPIRAASYPGTAQPDAALGHTIILLQSRLTVHLSGELPTRISGSDRAIMAR